MLPTPSSTSSSPFLNPIQPKGMYHQIFGRFVTICEVQDYSRTHEVGLLVNACMIRSHHCGISPPLPRHSQNKTYLGFPPSHPSSRNGPRAPVQVATKPRFIHQLKAAQAIRHPSATSLPLICPFLETHPRSGTFPDESLPQQLKSHFMIFH